MFCLHACLSPCEHGGHRGQKRASDSLGLDISLQLVSVAWLLLLPWEGCSRVETIFADGLPGDMFTITAKGSREPRRWCKPVISALAELSWKTTWKIFWARSFCYSLLAGVMSSRRWSTFRGACLSNSYFIHPLGLFQNLLSGSVPISVLENPGFIG